MKTEDMLTIVRDVKELERLGFKIEINEETGEVICTDDDTEITKELLDKLNSYMGVVKNLDYYSQQEMFEALTITKGGDMNG
jgi:cell division protein ZapA (FtsZ GTPase activity inhibitor)